MMNQKIYLGWILNKHNRQVGKLRIWIIVGADFPIRRFSVRLPIILYILEMDG